MTATGAKAASKPAPGGAAAAWNATGGGLSGPKTAGRLHVDGRVRLHVEGAEVVAVEERAHAAVDVEAADVEDF